MLREEVVFGPIRSRRLGNSLGINLLPENGKICNFDCIYCECGLNRDGRGDIAIPSRERVRTALEEKLRELSAGGINIDSITFSGDGEPTLNPEFAGIVDDTLRLRAAFAPSAKVSVLSNATRAHVPEIFQALCRIDNPIMKIDAPTDELAAKINCPAPGYDVARVVKALEKFNGDFVLQTMMLKSRDFDSASPEVLSGIAGIVRHLRPREIMVYSIDREVPVAGIEKFSIEKMKNLLRPLLDEGFNIRFF